MMSHLGSAPGYKIRQLPETVETALRTLNAATSAAWYRFGIRPHEALKEPDAIIVGITVAVTHVAATISTPARAYAP
jgi:hypothetical protein